MGKFSFAAKPVGEQKCIVLSENQLKVSRVAIVTGWTFSVIAVAWTITTLIFAALVAKKYLQNETRGTIVDFLGWTDMGNYFFRQSSIP